MKIKKGDIVETVNGLLGMVVYFRSNQEIGINAGHYYILSHQGISGKDLKERVCAMGCDMMLSKEDLKIPS